MSDKPPDFLLVAALIVVAGASTMALFALACRRWRATKTFLGLVALLWAAASGLFAFPTISAAAPIALSSWWRDSLVYLAILAPLAILPTACLLPCVAGSTSRRWIPIIAVVAWAVAFPMSLVLGIMLSCNIWHDCL